MTAAQWQKVAELTYVNARRFADNGWFIAAKSCQDSAAEFAKQARILMGVEE